MEVYFFLIMVFGIALFDEKLGAVYGQESPGWISQFKLAFFLLLKISRNLNFVGKIDWSMNSKQQRAGIARAF